MTTPDTFEREIETVDLADGDATIDLPRSHYYQRLSILLDYEVDVTDSTNASQNRAGILEAIQNMQVTLNGNQTIKSVDLEMNHLIDLYQYGTRPRFDPIDFSTGGVQSGFVQAFLDFNIPGGGNSAMLPSFRTSDFNLRLEAGDASDIEDGGDDLTVNALDVTVTSNERVRDSVPNESKVLSNLMIFKERQKRKTLDAAGETDIDLPMGNTYYATPFRVYDNDSPDDDLVESFEVESDIISTLKSKSYEAARAGDQQQYGFERSDLPTGIVYPNWGFRGNLNDVVSTEDMESFSLTVDTGSTSPTDPAEVEVVTQELITPD